MTSTHRLIAVFIIWAAVAFGSFYLVGSVLFTPAYFAPLGMVALLFAAVTATFIVVREHA
jgi:hypothetical protein